MWRISDMWRILDFLLYILVTTVALFVLHKIQKIHISQGISLKCTLLGNAFNKKTWMGKNFIYSVFTILTLSFSLNMAL